MNAEREKMSKSWESLGTELYLDTVFSHLKTTHQVFKQNGIQNVCTVFIGTMKSLIILNWLLFYINIAQQQQITLLKDLKNEILSPYLCKDVENLGCP